MAPKPLGNEFGHISCPKHNLRGKVQFKVYCCHWNPQEKTAQTCLLSAKDLPDDLEKLINDLRLRLIRQANQEGSDGAAGQEQGDLYADKSSPTGEPK